MHVVTLKFILVLLAAISFFVSAVELHTPRVNMLALGLFLLAVSMMVTV